MLTTHNSTPRPSEQWAVVAASSRHPGGVGTIACDVSYRFVTDSVSTVSSGLRLVAAATARSGLSLAFDDTEDVAGNDATQPQRYIGPSPYGVWGAYGTPNNGESVPLP